MLIYWGGRKTRRTEQVTDRLRTALEMDGQATGDETSSRAGRVEEASEGPNGSTSTNMLTADTTRPSTETAASAPGGSSPVLARDAEKGLDVPVGESQSQTKPQAMTMDRNQSTRSLQFAEEMVVPAAGDVPRS